MATTAVSVVKFLLCFEMVPSLIFIFSVLYCSLGKLQFENVIAFNDQFPTNHWGLAHACKALGMHREYEYHMNRLNELDPHFKRTTEEVCIHQRQNNMV